MKNSNKFTSQSLKYSSSSKSKSHSNSQNKESIPNKEKDFLEETISYIISDDEVTSTSKIKIN